MDQRALVSKIAQRAGLTDHAELTRIVEATTHGLGKALSAQLRGRALPELASGEAFFQMISERARVPPARAQELVQHVCAALAAEEPATAERLAGALPPEIAALLDPRSLAETRPDS